MSSFDTSQNRPQMRLALPRLTWAVRMLILITAAIYAAQLVLDPVMAWLVPAGSQTLFPPGGVVNDFFGFNPAWFLHGAMWMPLTYMFLHGGLMHLFMNMLWLFIFGPDVERALGTRHFFRFYIICGAIGVLAALIPPILFGARFSSVTGASGAVMGVLVAFAMIDPKRQFFLFPLPFPITAMGLVVIVLVMNVLMFSTNSGISVETHLGGMAAGYLYMKFLPAFNRWRLARTRKKAEVREKKLNRVGEAVDNIFEFKDRGKH